MSSSADLGPPQFPGSAHSDSKRVSLPPPPPPRISPDFRNGDFLSRLLAATPPYLYNIPLVPQSFFFSDMLKSFVAGTKQESSAAPPVPPAAPTLEFPSADSAPPKELPGRPPHRRRKRTWREMSEPPRFLIERKPQQLIPPPMDKPLELTNNNRSAPSEESSAKICRHESSPSRMISPERTSPPSVEPSSPPTLPPPNPLLLPGLGHCGMLPLPGTDFHTRLPSSDHISNDLVPSLPPFPPHMWYPSLYPGLGHNLPAQTPYGIDPLHFFIDLRVSGHIWDRKPPFGTGAGSPPGLDCTMEKVAERRSSSPHAEVSSSRLTELERSPPPPAAARRDCSSSTSSSSNDERLTGPLNLAANKPSLSLILGGSKLTKHTSAFSVPEPRPLMMTTKNIKKLENRKTLATTNYVLQNLPRIYEGLQNRKCSPEPLPEVETTTEDAPEPEEGKEGEGEGGKKEGCKDLPALIGLELVVDYVKQHEGKPGQQARPPPSPATPPAGDAAPPHLERLNPSPQHQQQQQPAEREATASP